MQSRLGGRVQCVDRALALLEELAQDDRGLRLTELARRTGLSPSTVHRLLTTLEERRFVQFSQVDNAWHVGLQAFAVGSAFSRERNFVAPAVPFLRRLRDQTRETANLGVVEAGEVVLVSQLPSREIARAISPVGGRTPVTASGMGKAVLSSYSRSSVHALVEQHGMRPFTRSTLRSIAALEGQLDEARRRGYAVDDEEFVPGLRCVAAPVYNDSAEVVCAISVSGVTMRMTSERVSALGNLVARTARELTATLGGRPKLH
jgi:IclR family transcriptional regulator, acetate operon repressor